MLKEHFIAATWELLTNTHFSPGSKADEFARAIEAEATEPLLARIAELEKDAERYRWLRSVPNRPKAQRIVNDTPEGMDAAIDAALKDGSIDSASTNDKAVKADQTSLAWFAFADDKLASLGRHESFELADAAAPGQTHWIFNETSLKQFVEQAIPMLEAPVITSVPIQHWSVKDGSPELVSSAPAFNLKVTDQRAMRNSFFVDVEKASDGANDSTQVMSTAFEINNLVDDGEHMPCMHLHFASGNLAFSLFKRGDEYILRPEVQVEIKPIALPCRTPAFVISE